MYKRIAIILFSLSIFTQLAYGRLYLYSFEERVLKSDIILVITVNKARQTFIGWKYASFEPLDIIKGEKIFEKMAIRYGLPFYGAQEDLTKLEEGKNYVVFLKKFDSYYIIVGADTGCFLIDENKNVDIANELIPLKVFFEKITSVIEKQNVHPN